MLKGPSGLELEWELGAGGLELEGGSWELGAEEKEEDQTQRQDVLDIDNAVQFTSNKSLSKTGWQKAPPHNTPRAMRCPI